MVIITPKFGECLLNCLGEYSMMDGQADRHRQQTEPVTTSPDFTSATEGEGGYVFTPFSLFVCVQDISKSCGWIRTKFGGISWVCDHDELIRFW